jgi:hypothetical protein
MSNPAIQREGRTADFLIRSNLVTTALAGDCVVNNRFGKGLAAFRHHAAADWKVRGPFAAQQLWAGLRNGKSMVRPRSRERQH